MAKTVLCGDVLIYSVVTVLITTTSAQSNQRATPAAILWKRLSLTYHRTVYFSDQTAQMHCLSPHVSLFCVSNKHRICKDAANGKEWYYVQNVSSAKACVNPNCQRPWDFSWRNSWRLSVRRKLLTRSTSPTSKTIWPYPRIEVCTEYIKVTTQHIDTSTQHISDVTTAYLTASTEYNVVWTAYI